MCLKCPWVKFILYLAIVMALTPHVSGQGYVLTHYNSRNGLGHDDVRAISADSSGFVWMATWDGLTRYDGTDFVNYYHDPADSTTIPYFSVNHLAIDNYDGLWISTDNALLALFNRTTEKFSRVRSLGGYSLNDLICFNPGPDGYLWFILIKGVLRYNLLTGEAILYPWRNPVNEIPLFMFSQYRLTFDDSGEPWLTGAMVINFSVHNDPLKGQPSAVMKEASRMERLPGRIGTFFDGSGYARLVRDTAGNRWLASLTGLFRYDESRNCFCEYDGDIHKIRFACEKPVIYYNHDSGLNICIPDRDSVMTINHDECGLPNVYLLQDPGLLWFSHFYRGGTPAGVVKVVFTPHEFRHISPFPEKSNQLNVFGIIRDDRDALWIAARDRNYLIRIGRDGVPERKLVLDDRQLIELWHPRAFLPDTGGLWIGYYYRKLLHYDLQTGKVEEHYPGKYAHTICYDRDGKILVAESGIIRYDPVSRRSETLLTTGDTVNWFTVHRQGNILWSGGSYSYLMKLNLATLEHEFIKIASSMANIEDICEDDNGILWLATLGMGICRFDTGTGEKNFYTTASGLSSNTTYSILRDRDGNIWVSTNNGISVINPSTGLIRSFSENDGLLIHEFNSDAVYETREGKFLFGGVGGAVEFDPLEVLHGSRGNINQQIIINEFDVSALSKTFDMPVYKCDTVILEKGDDNFHLTFIVPEYRSPEMIRYRYRIDGDAANWYHTDHTDRNINFSNLTPGWYNLEIEATDLNGSWSNRRILTIRIKPFFYQTTAFRVAMPLTLLLIISIAGWYFLRHLTIREQQKRDMLRHQALRGQMNPHFIFNALNSINYFISNNDRLSANRYIADFSKLIRTVLNNMNEDFVRLAIEIDALEDYLKIEHLRFGDKFDYSIEIEPEVSKDYLRVVPGLIQPFVENAIWHGVMGLNERKGSIRVSFALKGNILTCSVEDDGVGRSRSEEMKDKSLPRRSKGISLATERLKIVNNLMLTDCRIKISDLYNDREETGTRVEIELPVKS